MAKDTPDGTAGLDRLRAVVGAYGAEPRRWPATERARLEALAAGRREADWMVEARQVDALLDHAPGQALGRGRARGIAAAAMGAPTADPAKVVELRPRRSALAYASGIGQGAVLAASLLAGMWIGASGGIDAFLIADSPMAALSLTEEVEGAAPVFWWNPLTDNESLL
jgi:hypothetical protein